MRPFDSRKDAAAGAAKLYHSVAGRIRALTLVAGAVSLAASVFAQDGGFPYVAKPVLVFKHTVEPAMLLPTGVAVATDGTVYVADGVHDRILAFKASGEFIEEIRSVGDEALSRPLSVKVAADGSLWIADTGNARVLARAPDGSLLRQIRWPQKPDEKLPDVTDLAFGLKGESVWLVDNDNHRLASFDLATGNLSFFGEMGESLGQFNYPFMLASNPAGDVFVSEAVNGRVQIFSASGRVAGSLGTYGAGLGNLYRPKGIAVDRDGNAWVVDGTMGVVQVFKPNGILIDVLRDEQGKPFKLETPCGAAFDADGNFYVTELLEHRVRKLAVTVNPGARSPETQAPRRDVAPVQPRACTACHSEWLEPLVRGESTPLMAPPETSREHPAVSRPRTCLSCHDGSVVDSRAKVWVEHGHRRGVQPPESMNIPPDLPLPDGLIACRTCHSAHARGATDESFKTAVFLRTQGPPGALCVRCHEDHTKGPALGTHPIGGMPWPVPQKLIDAGARTGQNPRELTCRVCHTPHGAKNDYLLVLGTDSNQLCLACHDRIRPGMFLEGAESEHPLSPPASAEQVAAVKELGTKLSHDGKLICLSCHKLHHGKGERFMLADDLTDGKFCLHCHSDRKVLLETAHDLRKKFPEEKNRLGMTPHSGGPCSACHLFHRYARLPEKNDSDPRGQCITCHQDGRCGQAKRLGPVNHPHVHCAQCHDPHEPENGSFLRAEPAALCGDCHDDETLLEEGPHDITMNASAWPKAAQERADLCLSCHRPHGDETTGLFRVAGGEIGKSDAPCLACHKDKDWASAGKLAARHPRDVSKLVADHELPLLKAGGGRDERIGCRTCHNPHVAPTESEHLLRKPDDSGGLCVQCHMDQRHIALTGHTESRLAAAGVEAAACKPCHVLHADSTQVESKALWPIALSFTPSAKEPDVITDRYCTSCHRPDGVGPVPVRAVHPDVPLFNPFGSEAPGYLPLFDEDGNVAPRGKIACRTCHVQHGREIVEDPYEGAASSLSVAERRARRAEVRPFKPPNLCATCHGAAALRRYLYFHNPSRRQESPPVGAGSSGVSPRSK